MTAQRLAAGLLIGGSTVFFVGAAIGVPRVFMVPWVFWPTIGADALFLTVYLRTGDIPPFVFYLLATVAGIVVW